MNHSAQWPTRLNSTQVRRRYTCYLTSFHSPVNQDALQSTSGTSEDCRHDQWYCTSALHVGRRGVMKVSRCRCSQQSIVYTGRELAPLPASISLSAFFFHPFPVISCNVLGVLHNRRLCRINCYLGQSCRLLLTTIYNLAVTVSHG